MSAGFPQCPDRGGGAPGGGHGVGHSSRARGAWWARAEPVKGGLERQRYGENISRAGDMEKRASDVCTTEPEAEKTRIMNGEKEDSWTRAFHCVLRAFNDGPSDIWAQGLRHVFMIGGVRHDSA